MVMDGFFQINPSPTPKENPTVYESLFRMLDADEKMPRVHRWRMNMRTGQSEEYDLTDVISEFGMVNGRHSGRPHRYVYAATRVSGAFLFDGFVKHDLDTGKEEIIKLPEGVFGSEASMAPRVGGPDHHRLGHP